MVVAVYFEHFGMIFVTFNFYVSKVFITETNPVMGALSPHDNTQKGLEVFSCALVSWGLEGEVLAISFSQK